MRERNHKCEWCGKIYVTLGSQYVFVRTCSDDCRRAYDRERINIRRKVRYDNDPEWRAYCYGLQLRRRKKRLETDPEWRERLREYAREWNEERREERRESA